MGWGTKTDQLLRVGLPRTTTTATSARPSGYHVRESCLRGGGSSSSISSTIHILAITGVSVSSW